MLVAQIPKGKIMSEVGFNFSSTVYGFQNNQNPNTAKNKNRTFNINSTNRYFIKNNVYASMVLGYSNSLNIQPNVDSLGVQIGANEYGSKGYDISIGIGALRNLGSKFYVGTDVNVGVCTQFSQTSGNISYGNEKLQYFLNLKPQLYYHLKPKFLIFIDFGQAEYSYDSNNSGFSFNSKFNIFFSPRFWNYGFIFLWGKSKEKTTPN
jgi:ribosomal protein L27